MQATRLDNALHALEASTGVVGHRQGDDLVLTWRDRAHRFAITQRALVRPGHLPLLRELAGAAPHWPTLLVTNHVSPPLIEQLKAAGICFIDEAGNAFVETDDWMVLVTGRSNESRVSAKAAVSRAMWQVAYVLLRGGADKLTVRQLAEHAGVSHSTAANALAVFERHGWLVRYKDRHPLEDPGGLLRAFEFGYQDRLMPSLDMGFTVSPGTVPLDPWERSIHEQLGPDVALLGGELAAQRMGTDIVAATAVLYVHRFDAEIIRALRVAPARNGPIAVRRIFSDRMAAPDDPRLADALLVRAELLAIDDDRLDATRSALLQQITERLSVREAA